MRLLDLATARQYLTANGIPAAQQNDILGGFDFAKPVYEQVVQPGQVLFQFIRNPTYLGASQAGNWFALSGATQAGVGIFGGGSGRHLHKFEVAFPFACLEGTAAALARNWSWAGGGRGGDTQLYVPPRFIGHLRSLGPQ